MGPWSSHGGRGGVLVRVALQLAGPAIPESDMASPYDACLAVCPVIGPLDQSPCAPEEACNLGAGSVRRKREATGAGFHLPRFLTIRTVVACLEGANRESGFRTEETGPKTVENQGGTDRRPVSSVGSPSPLWRCFDRVLDMDGQDHMPDAAVWRGRAATRQATARTTCPRVSTKVHPCAAAVYIGSLRGRGDG